MTFSAGWRQVIHKLSQRLIEEVNPIPMDDVARQSHTSFAEQPLRQSVTGVLLAIRKTHAEHLRNDRGLRGRRRLHRAALEPDLVEVRTDDKGRFRAPLLPARPYSAYATWRSNDAPAGSAVHEHATAGAFLALRQQSSALVDLRIRVDGQKPWAKHGPLRFRVFPHVANMRAIPLAASKDGTVPIPPMPGSRCPSSWSAMSARSCNGRTG